MICGICHQEKEKGNMLVCEYCGAVVCADCMLFTGLSCLNCIGQLRYLS